MQNLDSISHVQLELDKLHNRLLCVEQHMVMVDETSVTNEENPDVDHCEEELIERYVDEMLGNQRINFFLIPDYVEKKIYVNMFCIILRLVKHVLKSSNMYLLNHRIRFSLEPNPKGKD